MSVGAGIAAGVGVLTGLAQALTSGKKKKEAALEAQAANAPKYEGSSALDQYYQQSLQKANTAAEQSALYKGQINQANRSLAAGVGATTASGGGQGAISKLVQGNVDATGRALGMAEQQREQRFGQLGQVTQQKSAEDMRKFQINKMQPWETKYNLLAAKAAQAAQQQQAGFSNIAGAAMNAATAFGGKGSKTPNNGGSAASSAGYDYDSRQS